MTRQQYQTVRDRFTRYVARYRDTAGTLPAMQELKWRHTACVVADAERVMAAEGWDSARCMLGRTAALLHDIGRFSQYDEFRTFQDSASVNHAERGCEVIRREDVLAGVPADDACRVLQAVRLHNRKELPPSTAPSTAELADLVRDADKLDIFRVFEEAVAADTFANNPEMVWNIALEGGVSEPVLEALEAGRAVDYREVSTFCDFVMVQVSWLGGQLRFAESRRLARERRVLEYRKQLVLARCGSPRLEAIFARLKEAS